MSKIQRTSKEAMLALLEHPSHKSLNRDFKRFGKTHECNFIAQNLCNFAKNQLSEEQIVFLFNNKKTIISKETIYSWTREEKYISPKIDLLLKLFLGEAQISELPILENHLATKKETETIPNQLIDTNLKELEGKTYWSYNRIMGAYDNFEYGGDNNYDTSNKLVSSLIEFGQLTPEGIKVRRKTSHFQYEGKAKMKGHILYIELEEPKNSINFEQNHYTARVDNSYNMKVLYFIRTCLVNGAPQAIREIMVEAEGINYATTEMNSEKRFVDIDALNSNYKAEIVNYLGDASNVILTTHSLKKEDFEARIQNFEAYMENNWSVAAPYLMDYTKKIAHILLFDTVEIPILAHSSIMHFYDALLNNMSSEHAFYVTSLASKEYLWQKESLDSLAQTVTYFIERGGVFCRFFFVNSLSVAELSDEQNIILKTHYEMYGNVAGNGSAVYLVNDKKLMPNQKEMIAMERKQKSIACNLYLKGKRESLEVSMDKLVISTNKVRIKKYAEIFDYFEECAQLENNAIVKKIGKEEDFFWKEKF